MCVSCSVVSFCAVKHFFPSEVHQVCPLFHVFFTFLDLAGIWKSIIFVGVELLYADNSQTLSSIVSSQALSDHMNNVDSSFVLMFSSFVSSQDFQLCSQFQYASH